MSKAKDEQQDANILDPNVDPNADRSVDPAQDPTLDEAERDRINAEKLEAKFHGYTPAQAERILKERDQPQPQVPEDLDPQRIEASEAEAQRKLDDPAAAQKEWDEQRAAPLQDPWTQAARDQEEALDKVDAKRDREREEEEEEAREQHDKKRK